MLLFFFSSRRRHTRLQGDWSSDVCSSDLWGAAYQQLADILIGAERQAYDRTAAAEGGWRGERAFVVEDKVAESAEITSFYLVPADGGPVIAHQPGQYIGLRLVVDGQEQRRNYSLSAPADGRSLRISVKREAGGKVSNFLHDRVRVGDTLQLFPPAGHFTLQPGERRSEEHTSELQSPCNLVCRLLLEKKKPELTSIVSSIDSSATR